MYSNMYVYVLWYVCVCVRVCACVHARLCVITCRLRFSGFSMRLVCFDPNLQGEGGCATSGSSSRSKRAMISGEEKLFESNSAPVKRLHARVIIMYHHCDAPYYREGQNIQVLHYSSLFLLLPKYDFSLALWKFLMIKVELTHSTELSLL